MTENHKFEIIEGKGIPVQGNDIDTDRIIPARFMKCVTFEGLGQYAFYDERFDEKGNKKKHSFNDEKFLKGSILIVNKNFGCGSSREHAPQALQKFGIKAIIGESFAEIFRGNCTVMGIPTVTAQHDAIENLMMFAEEEPENQIRIDLEKKKVIYGDFEIDVDIPESNRIVLVKGEWDSTAMLLANKDEIEHTAEMIPYISGF